MYETADMMSGNKRKIVAELVAESKAGKIPETPEGHGTKAASKPKPVSLARKAAAPAAKKVSAARKTASAIIASFRDTLNKTESDLIRFKQRLEQLDNDIRTIQRVCTSEYSPLLAQKKKEREEVQKKIAILQGIRDRCKQQLGMK